MSGVIIGLLLFFLLIGFFFAFRSFGEFVKHIFILIRLLLVSSFELSKFDNLLGSSQESPAIGKKGMGKSELYFIAWFLIIGLFGFRFFLKAFLNIGLNCFLFVVGPFELLEPFGYISLARFI